MDTGTLLYVLTIFQNGRKQKQQKIKVHQQLHNLFTTSSAAMAV